MEAPVTNANSDGDEKVRFVLAFVIFILLAGCSEKMDKNLSIRWSERHLYSIADDVTQAFLSSSIAKRKHYKYFTFEPIKNETYDHIDTQRLADLITAKLIQNGFIFLQSDRRQSSKMPDAIFHGKISALYQKNDRSKDMQYIFRLYLTDAKSAQEVWSSPVKIRDKGTKALIGW